MIDKINHWLIILLKVVSGSAIVFMALIAFVDAGGRQLHMPILGAYEFVKLALMLFFFASIGLVVRDDSQIRVGLMAELYKPLAAKIEGRITLVVEVIAMAGLSWMIFDQASRLTRFGTVSSFFHFPMGPWVFLGALMTLVGVWFAILNLGRWRTIGEAPVRHLQPGEEI
ncbi:TRAP transporter small permease subunit [Devosia sp. WQ 349]|uniref:TRAP transporter small permease n=1 Tax=Devosia sp. WQ 349K1 TaxID=2800329 RepID=UPI0019071F30|nr:TRAP transporter small permease subunit [Devosia sp. WQ 349K1]MBK1796098.1 TRAP transporter small permease subunit [Devosia sp. WQ 349K1]